MGKDAKWAKFNAVKIALVGFAFLLVDSGKPVYLFPG
jgi:hypothetical protein